MPRQASNKKLAENELEKTFEEATAKPKKTATKKTVEKKETVVKPKTTKAAKTTQTISKKKETESAKKANTSKKVVAKPKKVEKETTTETKKENTAKPKKTVEKKETTTKPKTTKTTKATKTTVNENVKVPTEEVKPKKKKAVVESTATKKTKTTKKVQNKPEGKLDNQKATKPKKETSKPKTSQKETASKEPIEEKYKKEQEDVLKEKKIEIEEDDLLIDRELEAVNEERKANKRLTKEQKQMMQKNAFHNCLAAVGMVAYFVLLALAYKRMETDVFSLDLKVFSGIFLVTVIILFEVAYKKDSGKIAMHAIELLAVAIITLLLTHIYELANGQFETITLILAGSAIVYYCIKCLIMVLMQMRKSKLQEVKEDINIENVETNERKAKE